MTEAEARELKVGNRVKFEDEHVGEVVEQDFARFRVKWDDGVHASYRYDSCNYIRKAELP